MIWTCSRKCGSKKDLFRSTDSLVRQERTTLNEKLDVPAPVRRVDIPKPDRGKRRLGKVVGQWIQPR